MYVKSAIELSKGTSGADDLPKAPYTPKIKSFSADYSAVYLLDGNLADSDETTFYHIGPFGARKDNLSEEASNYLIPYFKNQGALCIGLKKLNLPQTLSLLLQVSEGSANPATSPKPVIWSYLVNNNWVPFNETELLSDTSNGFINTGIIKFALPKTLQSHNTWLTEDTFWISASMETEPDSVAQLIDIQTQAITAVFEDTNNELSHLGEALPAGTIAKLKDNQSAIREIVQPYASFDGRLPENGSDYYRRVSERLRHKNRAITIWDFERLVLEEFPSVYKVKCLNHTRLENPYTERAPGHVSLVVISNLRNKNAVNPLQPRTSISILEAIKRFLSKIQNSFIELHTGNPDFEEIQVEFNVRFYAGKDENFYKKKLLEDIKEFLSPWAFFNGKDISFEGVIHKSKIINFIEELDYVDYLTCFKMYQISKDGKSEDLSEAQPTRSSAILVSSKEHLITVLTDDDCACDDKDGVQIINDGISVMTVALDLIVNKP